MQKNASIEKITKIIACTLEIDLLNREILVFKNNTRQTK